MKTEVETFTIPFEKITYSCEIEGCSFTTESKHEAEAHFGKRHAVSAIREIDEHDFYLIETEEGFKAWSRGSDRTCTWAGPGWYSRTNERVPCGRGCCTRDWIEIEVASSLVASWQGVLDEKTRALHELKTLVNWAED
jgi:hypothetical protein